MSFFFCYTVIWQLWTVSVYLQSGSVKTELLIWID